MADNGFSRPSLPQLISSIRSDLLTRFGHDPLLRRPDAEVYARVHAAAVHTLYGYIDYLAKNILPDKADEDWLVRHGNMKRCPRKAARAATGWVRQHGVTDGLRVAAGALIRRDDLTEFVTTATATASGGLLRLPVTCSVAGITGNTDDGTPMLLLSPVSGLSSSFMADTVTGGTQTEPQEEWRARITERWYRTPQGGADHDYVAWAKEVPGVARAWTYRTMNGPGTVGVMIATNDADNPQPSDDIVQAVKAHILPRAPVAGAGLTVFKPVLRVIPFSVTLNPDTEPVRTAVRRELNALMLRDGMPGRTLAVSRISEAISIATGEYSHRLTLPAQDIVIGDKELPVPGVITW